MCKTFFWFTFLLSRSPPRGLVWTQMPRCGRRCPWPLGRRSPTALTGPPRISVKVSIGTSPVTGQLREACANIAGQLLLLLDFWASAFCFSTGCSEPSSAGCKQFSVGFPALEDRGSTATSEVAVNGMDPPDLRFSPADANAETTGQWHHEGSSAQASRSLGAGLVYLLSPVMLLMQNKWVWTRHFTLC